MWKFKSLAAAFAVVAVVSASAPATAGAAKSPGEGVVVDPTSSAQAKKTAPVVQDDVTAQAYGECAGSWIEARYAGLKVRSQPDAASTEMFTLIYGELRACRKLVVGARYTACGVSNANGWIMIQALDLDPNYPRGWSGFIPSVCTVDHS